MIWSDFKTMVKDFLGVDKNRLGPIQRQIDLHIRSAVIDVQRFILSYRLGHENVYGVDDLVEEGAASRGLLPEKAMIQDAWIEKTGYMCVRQPLTDYNWDNRFDLICGNVKNCEFAISIDPNPNRGASQLGFYVYPKLEAGRQVSIFWDGLKLDFLDTETVPFDEQMAECVSFRVKGFIELAVNKDSVLSRSYYDPRTKSGHYYEARAQLYLDGKESKRQRATAPSPHIATGCDSIGIPPDDTTIEWVAFGDSGDPLTFADTLSVAGLAKDLEPDFVLHLGDTNLPTGDPLTLRANLITPYSNFIPAKWFQCFGNHDEDSDGGAALWALFPALQLLNSGLKYYSFTRGPATFFVLDSGATGSDVIDPLGTQGAWLKSGLAASTAKWNIVAIHKAPYSSDITVNPGAAGVRLPFQQWGAHLVLSGYGRQYERFQVSGIPYLVIGTGGATRRALSALVAGSQFNYQTGPGLVRFTANSTRLQFAFYDPNQKVIDNVALYK